MKKKVLAFVSGGLDSHLAVAFMQAQGLEVEGVSYFSHFTGGLKEGSVGKWVKAIQDHFKIKMHYKFLREEFVDMIANAKYGYGKGINPCIDCKVLMFSKGRELMEEIGASFVVTGEVIGQRPMSQLKRSLAIIERDSGLGGLILRPLSAKVLEPTIPEKEGWVDRELLGDIEGRSRSKQMEYAQQFGITKYPQPAGGCILTEKVFAKKMRDTLNHGYESINEFWELQFGRALRLRDDAKAIAGRNERECDALIKLATSDDYIFRFSLDVPGPVVLLKGRFDEETKQLCAQIVKYFSKQKSDEVSSVEFYRKGEDVKSVEIEPIDERFIKGMMIN